MTEIESSSNKSPFNQLQISALVVLPAVRRVPHPPLRAHRAEGVRRPRLRLQAPHRRPSLLHGLLLRRQPPLLPALG